jgi:hypothetical protein
MQGMQKWHREILMALGHDSFQIHPPSPSFCLMTSPSFEARSSVPHLIFWAAASFFTSVIGRALFDNAARKKLLASSSFETFSV